MPVSLVRILSTFFYIGFFPVAPGTLASAAGVVLVIAFSQSIALYIGATIVLTILGFMVSGRAEEVFKRKDPGFVVIDEVVGILISFFMLPLSWPVIIITFFLFRAFDMFKIYPANILESRHGATGIMMDDVVAGLYTNFVMHAALYILIK